MGSSSQCDIYLKDPKLALTAALIQSAGDGRYLLKNTGASGTLSVQGKAVDLSPLWSGAEITIGDFKMQVDIIQQIKKPRRGALANVQVCVEHPTMSEGNGPSESKTGWTRGGKDWSRALGDQPSTSSYTLSWNSVWDLARLNIVVLAIILYLFLAFVTNPRRDQFAVDFGNMVSAVPSVFSTSESEKQAGKNLSSASKIVWKDLVDLATLGRVPHIPADDFPESAAKK